MKGELAQVVSLVSHGNAWLKSDRAEAFRWKALSAFRHVATCRFVSVTRRVFVIRTATMIAADPADWLAWVAQNGGTGLSMVVSSDLQSLVRADNLPQELWRSHLKRRHKSDSEAPWDQEYQAVSFDYLAVRPEKSVASASADLNVALHSIIALARELGLQEWAARFETSRSILDGDDAAIPYYPDLVATQQREAHRLAAASVAAAMFSGAGSWQDVETSVRKRTDYKEATRAARAAVLDGLAAAANVAPTVASTFSA